MICKHQYRWHSIARQYYVIGVLYEFKLHQQLIEFLYTIVISVGPRTVLLLLIVVIVLLLLLMDLVDTRLVYIFVLIDLA